MSILPFGCGAYAVKPQSAYSKTRMESRAWAPTKSGPSLQTASLSLPTRVSTSSFTRGVPLTARHPHGPNPSTPTPIRRRAYLPLKTSYRRLSA
eukprot:5600875-Pleurochrysis_carterae.AAC.1